MDTQEEPKHVIIYTDGGCIGNPGPGGYGVLLLYQGHKKELSNGFAHTTNNRMELKAAIAGLGALKSKCKVTLYSDSKYLVDSISKGWVERWRANGWWRTPKHSSINIDFWKELMELCDKHIVDFVWVKGHADSSENNRCDALSVRAAKQKDLPVDEGYLNPETPSELPQKLSKAKKHSELKLGEGEPCRKCAVPLIKKMPKPSKSGKVKSFYYEYYFFCPGCKTMYMPEEAKRESKTVGQTPSLFAT